MVTLNYLKDGKRIHLNDHSANNQKKIYLFSSIHYTKNGVNYPALKDQGTFTVTGDGGVKISSRSIVADGVYKVEFDMVPNDGKIINFTYTIGGVEYLKSISYGELKEDPNLLLQ